MTEIIPSSAAICGNRIQRNDESANNAQQHSQLVNGSSRFLKSPAYIKGELRDYQIEALNWLISLYGNKLCGILADEIGLGKTLQSISILGYLKFFENVNGPFLVIGTTRDVSSWMDEFKKFCPSMRVIQLIDGKRKQDQMIHAMNDWDVCVTTFEMVSKDIFFRKVHWHYIIIDEAHRLINENTSKSIREISSEYRLLLTDTPPQNNLHELWMLLNYLMPDIFNRPDAFKDCGEGNAKYIQEIIQRFLLRRMKSDVETSLLPKIDMKCFVGLAKLQRDTYIKTINDSVLRTQDSVLESLRKIANHPYLIRGVEPGPPYENHGEHLINTSGKMMVLHKLLPDLKQKGSRVLLFTQFGDMLNIIEDYLIWQNYTFCRLDTRTNQHRRAKDIDRLHAEHSNIFIYIIATGAATFGINLQTADTVILYDSDWNPQNDLQAIAHAHRIGQKKQVRVFRLITENTVDEFIVQRAEVKLRLTNTMVERGRCLENRASGVNVNLRFGFDSIQASDVNGISNVNLAELIAYSESKTAEETKKLDNLNEDQLRSIAIGKTSVVAVNNNRTRTRMTRRGHRNLRSQATNRNQLEIISLPPSSTSNNSQNTTLNGENSISVTGESARMLVILHSGEQRLITFMLPMESCTVQDLLQQAGLPFTNHTDIQSVTDPVVGFDYVVSYGESSPSEIRQIIYAADFQLRQMRQQLEQQQQQQHHQKQLQQQQQHIHQQKSSSIIAVDTVDLAKQKTSEPTKFPPPKIVTGNSQEVRPKCGVCRKEHYRCERVVYEEDVILSTSTDQTNGSRVSEFSQSDQNKISARASETSATPNSSRNSNSDGSGNNSSCNQILQPANETSAISYGKRSKRAAKCITANETSATPNRRRNGNSDTPTNNSGDNISPSANETSTSKESKVTELSTGSATTVNSSQSSTRQVNQNLSSANEPNSVSLRRYINLNVYQFYPEELVLMCNINRLLDMSTDTETKEALLVQGFQEWSHADYIAFCNAVQKFGRSDVASVAEAMPNKREEEILKYHEVFFRRGAKECADIDGIINSIKMNEMSNRKRNKAFQWKMLQLGRPEFLSTRIAQKQNVKFTSDHDRYLICAISRYGRAFNVSDRVISDIRFHSDFGHFSTFRFGTISDQEIIDRVNELVVTVRKDYMASGLVVDIENDNAKKRKLN